MKTCRVCQTEKQRYHFHGDKTKTDGLGSICKSCASARARTYYIANGEPIRQRASRSYRENKALHLAQSKKWHAENPAKSREIKKRWQDANKERHNARTRQWAALNKERRSRVRATWKAANAARVSAANAAWSRNNPAKRMATKAARRAREKFATPGWADLVRIESVYATAALRTKETGQRWQVDHIVPLVSPLVCGLHVESNLQVVPAFVNQSKNNRWWPNMPGVENGAS